jgi:hypothetical protein
VVVHVLQFVISVATKDQRSSALPDAGSERLVNCLATRPSRPSDFAETNEARQACLQYRRMAYRLRQLGKYVPFEQSTPVRRVQENIVFPVPASGKEIGNRNRGHPAKLSQLSHRHGSCGVSGRSFDVCCNTQVWTTVPALLYLYPCFQCLADWIRAIVAPDYFDSPQK